MSRVMIDGVILTPSQEQAFYLDMETEGSRTPAQLAEAEELQALEDMMSESGIRRVEQLLDGEQMRRVLTLTPEAWRHMSAPERAVMTQWIERRVKVLAEKLAFCRRNAGPDLDVPDLYKVGAL